MKRILPTIQTDVRLQMRNGFYYAVVFVAVVLVLALTRLNVPDYRYLWPTLTLGNLLITTFYFMAGLVLLEKSEGTMEAQIITPLRPAEYLASKVTTLGLLSLLESSLIVILLSGFDFNWPLFAMGVLLTAAIYSLFGFIAVAGYDSINEFLFPSVLWVLASLPPLLYAAGVSDHWLFWLHPLQAPLVLIRAAFNEVPNWHVVYGLAYGLVSVGVVFYLSLRVFRRFVIRREGTR